MFDRLTAWWNWGADPRQPLPAEVVPRLEKLTHQWHAALAVMDTLPDHGRSSTLPWFLVIGPTGSGKSTLLANAGLGLDPIISTGADQVVVAGDFTCWIGPQAVFVEVAGPLLCDNSRDHDWHALLWMISRTRGHLPLRGVLLVKPLAEQFRHTPAETAADATLTRDRLQALAELTGAVVPTYVVISKADLLGGFKEFFAVRGRSEQVLGLTMPWPPERDPVHGVNVAYERLLDSLRDRRLTALAAGTSETAQRKLMQFPAQLRAALPYLTDHLAIAVRPAADSQPILRGVYLTSILPTPRRQPAEKPKKPVSEEDPKSMFFAVPAAVPPGTVPPTTPTAATAVPNDDRPLASFVQELFARVVLPDAKLASLTPAALQRLRQVRVACLIVLPAVSALLLIWSAWSTWHGIRLIEELRTPLAAVGERQRAGTSDATAPLLALDQLGSALRTAVAHHGADLGPAGEVAAGRYVRALRPLLLDACLNSVRAELATLRQPTANQTSVKDGAADLLRAYQMLGGMIEAQPALITRALLNERRWFRAVDPPGGTCEFRIEALARQQLDVCLTTLLPAGLLRVDIDRPLVEALHRELGDRLLIDQAYEELVRDLTPRFSVVPPESLLHEPEYNALGATTTISRLYTQESWDETVAKAIENRADRLMTTLAESALPHDRATIVSRLRQRFVDDHQRRWLAVIASMRAAQVRDFRDTAAQIDRLCGNDSPMPQFLTSALAHVALNVADASTRSLTDTTWIKPCLHAISSLRSDVIDHQQAMTLAKRATDVDRLRLLIGRFNAVSLRISELIAQVEPPATRTAIQAGFDGLLRSLVADLDRSHVEELDRQWSEQVFQTFDAHLAKRFPFNREASEDVPMAEFAAFFGPDGTLWSVLKQTETMRDITVLGRPAVTLSDDYPRLLHTAQDIRTLFFAGSSPTMNLRFSYRMQQREHVRDLRMQFGAATNTLYERPDARHQVGIIQGGPYGARISLLTVEDEWKHREGVGEWGFLRLLRDGQPRPATGGDLVCTWDHEVNIAGKPQNLKATIVVEAGNMASAVNGELLSGLVLPRRIVQLAGGR